MIKKLETSELETFIDAHGIGFYSKYHGSILEYNNTLCVIKKKDTGYELCEYQGAIYTYEGLDKLLREEENMKKESIQKRKEAALKFGKG